MRLLIAMLAIGGPVRDDAVKAAEIRAVRSWEVLQSQPAIQLGDGVKVRLGVEANRIPQWSGAYLYCLAENYVPPNGGSGDPLGPLQTEFVVDGSPEILREGSKYLTANGERPKGTYLYVRSLPIPAAKRYRLTVKDSKGRVLGMALVEGTREFFHPWMPWLDGLYDPEAPRAGIVLPHVDNYSPLAFLEPGVVRTEPLPTYLPNDQKPKLTIERISDEVVIRSETDFTSSRPDYHFLARWWVNDKPFLPKQIDDLGLSAGYGRVSEDKELRVSFAFRPERLGAKAGDKIGLQLMHSEGEWELCADRRAVHSGGSSRKDGENIRVSNRIEFVVAAQSEPRIVTTIAGTGLKGHTGDGGLSTKATLSEPFHVDFDPKGFLYIAESSNHCIRKVDLKTHTISTVAGTGKAGYSGDGGPAIAATFKEPYAVVVDPKGNLYVVDRLNAAIRKIEAVTGNITTVAGNGTKGSSGDGGLGVKAHLVEPNDCFLDGKGSLLIADVGDGRIRRLDLETGMISTFAGIGRVKNKDRGDGGPANRAVVTGARAVCVDKHGNVYVCEREGNSIRKIDAAGIITTIAGTGKAGDTGDGGDAKMATFKGPKGIRADAAGNLYVVDTENHAVRKIDAKTNIVTTVAGGKKGSGGDGGPANRAGFDRPHGCVVAPDGTLYIADSNNHRVRAVRME